MTLFGKTTTTHDESAMAYRRRLVANMIFEVIPLKSVDAAIEALPPESEVSVTASPVKGMPATVELTDRIRARGHRPIPHISARLVESAAHTKELADWTRTEGYERVFVIAGDAEEPHGPYDGAHAFLRDFFEHEHGATTIGIASYPDGHAIIPEGVCHEQLHLKQALIAEAGLDGWASTQMCFDTDRIVSWLRAEREEGFTLPVHLGIPGVVDRTKLMTMGVRLGVGASLRYLKKNRAAVTKLMAPGHYDPDDILVPMVEQLEPLGIEALHVFTFNQVDHTDDWRRTIVGELS